MSKAQPKRRRRKSPPSRDSADFETLLRRTSVGVAYQLRLFVTGTTPRSSRAISNIRTLCEQYLHGRYTLEVVDIYQQPNEAVQAQIIAAPTLVKREPLPLRRIIGDLSDRDRVLIGLDLQPRGARESRPRTKWFAL